MERGEVTAVRERDREQCDGWEMNREEGGGRAAMASHILFWEKLALGKSPIRQSGGDGRPFVQLADRFIRPASWTDRRTWGEMRGDARFSS